MPIFVPLPDWNAGLRSENEKTCDPVLLSLAHAGGRLVALRGRLGVGAGNIDGILDGGLLDDLIARLV